MNKLAVSHNGVVILTLFAELLYSNCQMIVK